MRRRATSPARSRDAVGAIEYRDALRLAHEALKWLSSVRVYLDARSTPVDTIQDLSRMFEVFAVAEVCAELHAAGPEQTKTIADITELLGWHGGNGAEHACRRLAVLQEDGFLAKDSARLVVR